jgi:hypothetical protein
MPREPLINSGSFRCVVKMSRVEAQFAANSYSIRKICNEGLAHFNQQLLIHELIRGSLILLASFKLIKWRHYCFLKSPAVR